MSVKSVQNGQHRRVDSDFNQNYTIRPEMGTFPVWVQLTFQPCSDELHLYETGSKGTVP